MSSPLPSKVLSFSMQHQQQTNWCWSAVATSTSLFYNPGSTWTQCSLANNQLGQATCCQNGGSSACNAQWFLDSALTGTGNLKSWASGTTPFANLQAKINSSQPVGARIGWSGGGGHFVIIGGYNTAGGQYLSIMDPWYGSSTYTYSGFSTSYQGTGTWTTTYYTQP